MVIKRNNVFETNSSSTHSITVIDNSRIIENDGTIRADDDGNVYIYLGQFGWEVESYDDNLTKARYALTDNYWSKDTLDLIIEAIKSVIDCKEVIILDEEDGYVDHQSAGTSEFYSVDEYVNFIFNPNVILNTDNDNY